MIHDLIITKSNMYVRERESIKENKAPKVREATQEDFDKF